VKVVVLVKCNPLMDILVVRVVVVLVLLQAVGLEVLEIGLPILLRALHQIKEMRVVVDMDSPQITLELVEVVVVPVVLEKMEEMQQ
tara:strand:- start:1219 stop:1476 length:258 start_codon:yes stop_codon:yes gene_type:complete